MRKHLTIENKIYILKINESNPKETNEKVGKIFYDIHNKYVTEKTVRMVLKDREKIQASANLQITVEKNLRNKDKIKFMDYRGGQISTILAHSTILGTPFVLGAYISQEVFAKLCRFSAKNIDDIGHFRRYGNKNYFS